MSDELKELWSLPKEVTIVKSVYDYVELDDDVKIPKAFVVFDNNKKTMSTAVNWACYNRYVNPEIVTLPNSADFTVSIMMPAGMSSQGGKLSFWNCRIRNEKCGLDVSVGINQSILCDLLLQSTFVNGVCQSNVVFAKRGSELGVVAEGSYNYKQALMSQSLKAELKVSKTTKWERGCAYRTLTESDVYIGDVYRPVEIEREFDYRRAYSYHHYYLNKNPLKRVTLARYYIEEAEYDINKIVTPDEYGRIDFSNSNYLNKFPSRSKDPEFKPLSIEFTDELLREAIAHKAGFCLEHFASYSLADALMSIDGVIDEASEELAYRIADELEDRDRIYLVHVSDDDVREFEDIHEALDLILSVLKNKED